MTDNEIVKALECFALDKDFDEKQCIGCAFEHQFCTANMSVADIEITLGHKDITLDLCTDCLEELRKQIEHFCQKGNVEFKGVNL